MQGQANVDALIGIEINFDHGLFVGMKVFFDDGSGPVQQGGVLPMANLLDTLYVASFTPAVVGVYYFYKQVYTDDTYTTVDTDYSENSESIQVIDSPSEDIALILRLIYQIIMLGGVNVQVSDNQVNVEVADDNRILVEVDC